MTYEEYWQKRWPLIDRRHDVAWSYLRDEKSKAYMGLWPFPHDLKIGTKKEHKEWLAYCAKMEAWAATKEDVERGVAAFWGAAGGNYYEET